MIFKFLAINAFMIMACNMVHPITPAFLTNLALPDYMFGAALGAMAFTNFLFSPFWGKLSDSAGRLRVTNISLLGYAVSQIAFMLAGTEVTVILSRILSGVFAGGFVVGTMAYLADITNKRDRPRYMLYFVAFQSVSASMGFLIGGFIGDYSIPATFIAQVMALIISILLYASFLKESIANHEKVKQSEFLRHVNPFLSFFEARKFMTPAFFVFLVVVFLTTFAAVEYDAALNYYVRQIYGFAPSHNGMLKAATGIVGLLTNFTINQWLVKHTDGRKSLVGVMLICGVVLLAVSNVSSLVPFLILNVVFFAFNSMYMPIQQTLVVEGQKKEASNGLLFGIFNSVKALGMIGGSFVAGFAYQVKPTLPFLIAAAVFVMAAGFGLLNVFQYRKT